MGGNGVQFAIGLFLFHFFFFFSFLLFFSFYFLLLFRIHREKASNNLKVQLLALLFCIGNNIVCFFQIFFLIYGRLGKYELKKKIK